MANEVLAEALKYFMGSRWNNSTLGKEAGVAPNTIRNYLKPGDRDQGASGKAPSAKLAEVEAIAEVFGLEVADLVTDMTSEQRHALWRRRAADYYSVHGVLPPWAPDEAKPPKVEDLPTPKRAKQQRKAG